MGWGRETGRLLGKGGGGSGPACHLQMLLQSLPDSSTNVAFERAATIFCRNKRPGCPGRGSSRPEVIVPFFLPFLPPASPSTPPLPLPTPLLRPRPFSPGLLFFSSARPSATPPPPRRTTMPTPSPPSPPRFATTKTNNAKIQKNPFSVKARSLPIFETFSVTLLQLSPSPQIGPRCRMRRCSLGKQGQKLQSDVIKLSSPARGTLNKETFLRGCFFLSFFKRLSFYNSDAP